MGVNHHSIWKVLTWINWVIMLGLGCYNAYVQFKYDNNSWKVVTDNPVNKLLSIYIALFGLIGCIFEGGVKAVQRALKFLMTKSGHGVLFLFVGTLGLAFVNEDGAGHDFESIWNFVLCPAILGGFSCGVGIYSFIAICCGAKNRATEDPAEGDYVDARDAQAKI